MVKKRTAPESKKISKFILDLDSPDQKITFHAARYELAIIEQKFQKKIDPLVTKGPYRLAYNRAHVSLKRAIDAQKLQINDNNVMLAKDFYHWVRKHYKLYIVLGVPEESVRLNSTANGKAEITDFINYHDAERCNQVCDRLREENRQLKIELHKLKAELER